MLPVSGTFGHCPFSHMLDNETFRLRIGLFACKRPRTQSKNAHIHINKFIPNKINIFESPCTPHITDHINQYMFLFYYLIMTYFLPILLSMTKSLNTLNPLDSNIDSSLLLGSPHYLIPFLACSHIKLFSVIVFSWFLRNFLLPGKMNKVKYSSRFRRLVSLCILWVFSLNFILITLVNPSMLNPGPNSLSVLYQNVQGLIPFSNLSSSHPLLDGNKISELQSFANIEQPDIIALNETWLKNSIASNEILPSSQYEVFRNDRTRKTHPQDPNNPKKFRENGGGVLLAVRSDLDATTTRIPVSLGAEMLAVKISFPNKESIVICTCYRVGTLGLPNHDVIVSYIRKLVSKKSPPKIYVIGDFNLPHTDWLSSSSTVSIEQSFIDSFSDLSLSQLIMSPTHKSGNTLDILLSNYDNTIGNLNVCDPHSVCKSDHFPVTFSIKSSFSRKKTPKRKIYNFKKANWDMINRELCSIDWKVLECLDPDLSWKLVKECIMNLVDRHIPKVTIKSEFQPPWFDSELFSSCRKKDRLRDKFKISGSISDELKFDTSRKDFKRLSSAKIRDNLFNSDDPALITKKFWSHVKYQSNSCRIPNCVSYSGQLRFKPKDQAELFNSFFFNQFSDPSLYDTDISYANDSDYDIDFDHRDVRKLLSNINSNKAQGPDGIHGKILKNCSVGLAYPLTCIFRGSYNSGYIPQEWKLANVVPIFKKGKKSEVENYRPISLTCLVMKVFERIVKRKLLSLTSTILDPRQHGFLEQKSCTTNMVNFCDSLALSLNENIVNHVVYFDFAKAFDSVNHDILLHKLKTLYNIDGTLLKFLTNYLQGRYQRVVIGNEMSSTLSVNSGVPQGSILGPLLFVLFINDIPLGLSDGTDIVLYADDTKIWRKIHSSSDNVNLQMDIDYLSDWALRNKMRFHPAKCKVLVVSGKPSLSPPFAYNLDGSPLLYVDLEKDLGVDITPKLSWNSQCDRIYTKACQQLGMVRRNGHIVIDQKRRRALYLSLVRSQFENCSIIWRPCNKSLSDKLESLQKKAIKWILSEEGRSYPPEQYVKRCKLVDILPLSQKFDLNDLIFFHKVLNNLIPVSLPYYLSLYQGTSRLRRCHLDSLSIVSSILPKLSQNSHNTCTSNNPLEKSFFYRTHILWNGLPLQVRQIVSTSLFKSEVTKHLWKCLLDSSA